MKQSRYSFLLLAGALFTSSARAEVAPLFSQSFDGLAVASPGTAVGELSQSGGSTGSGWFRLRAGVDKYESGDNQSLKFFSNSKAQYIASEPVSGNFGKLTFRLFIKSSSSSTPPQISVFLAAAPVAKNVADTLAFPNIDGIEVVQSAIDVDMTILDDWQDITIPLGLLGVESRRVFIGRMTDDRGYDVMVDDITLHESVSTLAAETQLTTAEGADFALAGESVTPQISFTRFLSPSNVVVELHHRVTGDANWQTNSFSIATTNAETGVISYSLEGGTLGVGAESGAQLEMFATATYNNQEDTIQSVALEYTETTPLRIDILPKSRFADSMGHVDLAVSGAFETPMDATTNGVWVSGYERGGGVNGDAFRFDFGAGGTYGATGATIPLSTTLAGGESFSAPASLNRDVVFRYDENGDSFLGVVNYGDVQTFENWAGTQANGWSLSNVSGRSAVTNDASLAKGGTHALFLAAGDSLVLSKSSAGMGGIGFWMRRADSSQTTKAIARLLRHRTGQAASDLVNVYTNLPTARYAFRSVEFSQGQNPMATDGFTLTAVTDIFVDGVYATDSSTVAFGALNVTPTPVRQHGAASVTATYTLTGGGRLRADNVAVHWGQGSSAAFATNTTYATSSDGTTWTATLQDIDRADADLYVWVGAVALDWRGDVLGTIASPTNCVRVEPHSDYESVAIRRTVGGVSDETPMRLAGEQRWIGALVAATQQGPSYQFCASNETVVTLLGGENATRIPSSGAVVEGGSIAPASVSSALFFEYNEGSGTYRVKEALYAPLDSASADWKTTGTVAYSAAGATFSVNATLTSPARSGVGQVMFWARRTTAAAAGYEVRYNLAASGDTGWQVAATAAGAISGETFHLYSVTVPNPEKVRRIRITVTGAAAQVQDVIVTASGAYVELSNDLISTNAVDFVTGTTDAAQALTVPYGSSPWLRVDAVCTNGADNLRVFARAVVLDEDGSVLEDYGVADVEMESDSANGGTFTVQMPTFTAGRVGYHFVAVYDNEDGVQATATLRESASEYLVYITDDNLENIRNPNFSGLNHNGRTNTTTIVDNWEVRRAFLDRYNPSTVAFAPDAAYTTITSDQAFDGIGRIYFKARVLGLSEAAEYAEHLLTVEVSSDKKNWEAMNTVVVPYLVEDQYCIEIDDRDRDIRYGRTYLRFVRDSTSYAPNCYLYLRDIVVTPPPANIGMSIPSIIHPGYPSQNDDITFQVNVTNVHERYQAQNYQPTLLWRRVFGSVAEEQWRTTAMTNAAGDTYACTLPAMTPGRVEYYISTTFAGAAYPYEYDPAYTVHFYLSGNDIEVEGGDPKNGRELSSPAYLFAKTESADEFSIATQQRALVAPGRREGENEGVENNLFLWFKVRAFNSHHRELQFVYTDEKEVVEDGAEATVHTNALHLVGDETWLTTIPVTNSVLWSGHIYGVDPYEGAATTKYGVEPTRWGDANQLVTNPPLASVATNVTATPIMVDHGMKAGESTRLMVRLDTTTGAYQIRQAAYQDFNDWSADQTYFEDSLGLYDTMTYEQAFDGSSEFPETPMGTLTMTFQPDATSATDGMQDTLYTTYGWRLRNGRILREREADATQPKIPNIAAEIWPVAGYLENDSGISANDEGLEYISLRYRNSFGGDGNLPYYKSGFDWKDYTLYVSNLTVSAVSPANPYVQIIAGYSDEDNYVAMRLTQLRDLNASDGGRRVKQELIKVQNGVETVLSCKTAKNHAAYGNANVTSNLFNGELTGSQSSKRWYLALSVTNNSVEGYAYLPGNATNRLYASGALAGTDSAAGGTISFDVLDAVASFGVVTVRDGTSTLYDSSRDTSGAKWNMGGVQAGTTTKRWAYTGGFFTRAIPPLPFTIGVCKAGTSESQPSGATYDPVYSGTAQSLTYSSVSQPVHYWGNTFVRISPQVSDARLVVDDVEVKEWHGRDLPDDITDDRYWQAHEAVVVMRNSSRQLALTTSRANPAKRQMIATPEMLQGIGTISFNYEVEGGDVTFQIERNTVDGSYSDGAGYSIVGEPIQAHAGDKGEIFRAIRLNQTGKIRIRIIQEQSGSDATLYIDNLFAKGFPPDDGRSWKSWNTLIVAPTRNRLTDAKQFEEDIITQTAFLNNSVDDGTRANDRQDEHRPFVMSPIISTGIGEIGFWYRAWDSKMSNPGNITLWVADTPDDPDAMWRQITEEDLAVPERDTGITDEEYWASPAYVSYTNQIAALQSLSCITNEDFRYFTIEICNDTNYVLRICSDTNDVQRVAIDNVIVTEPVRASIDILSVELISSGEFPDIPLAGDPVGFLVKLGNPRMNPTDIHVYADYYIGTNVWGVANWSANPRGHIELRQDEEDRFLYRSTEGDKIPGLPVDTVVQYRTRVTYTGSFAKDVVDASFSNPPWYEPVDLNSTNYYGNIGFSPYYFVFSCPTGVVFINEFFPSSTTGNDSSEFIEFIGPANLSLKDWKVDIVDADLSEDEDEILATYTLPENAGFIPPAGSSHGWGFFVVGDDFTNAVNYVFDSPGSRNLPTPGGIRIRRSMGAYVDRVSYGGSGSHAANAMVNRGYRYAGARSTNSRYVNRTYRYISATDGDEDIFNWDVGSTIRTMGDMNTLEVADLWDICPFTVSGEFASASAEAISAYFDKHLPTDFLIRLTVEGFDDGISGLVSVKVDGTELPLGTGYTFGDDPEVDGAYRVSLLATALSELNLATNGTHTVTLTVDDGIAPTVTLEVRESEGGNRSASIVPSITDFKVENGKAVLTLIFTNEDEAGTTAEGWKWTVLSSATLDFNPATTNGWTSLTDAALDVETPKSINLPANADAQFYKAVTTDDP